MAPDPTKPVAEITEFNRHVYITAASPDGSTFVAEGIHEGPDGQRRTVRAFDGLTGSELWSIPSTSNAQSGNLKIDPTGELLLFADGQGPGTLVELRSAKFRGERRVSRCLSPGAKHAAEYGPEGYAVSLLRGDSDEPFLRFDTGAPSHCKEPRFSPDGQRVAWGDQQGTVFVCEIREVLRRLGSVGLDH